MNITYYLNLNALCVKLGAEIPGNISIYGRWNKEEAPEWIEEMFSVPGVRAVYVNPTSRQVWISRVSRDYTWASIINDRREGFGIETIIGQAFCPDGAVSRTVIKFSNVISIPR